jgi:hypothetical protein
MNNAGSALRAFVFATLSLVGACGAPNDERATRTSALVGDPIESVQQTEGVAPTVITIDSDPNGSIKSTSFTIGLFTENEAECQERHPPYSYCVDDDYPGTEFYDWGCWSLTGC